MTGRRCSVCTNPAVGEIDRALVEARASLPELARRFEISVDALWRHRKAHVRMPGSKVMPVDVTPAEPLCAALENLERRLVAVLRRAETAADARTILVAVRAAERLAGLRARLSAQPPPGLGPHAGAPVVDGFDDVRRRVAAKLEALSRRSPEVGSTGPPPV